jgi:PAS domain-containing protein
MIFVPVIVAVALLSSLPQALAVSASAVGAYFIIGQLTGGIALVAAVLNGAVFMLAGVTAGLLAGELRSHYRGEKESHRLATAVRHRLLAVLDAVDEAIVFRDRKGTLRLVNERAERLFEVRSDEYLGTPAVELLRRIARQTEDPEGFMETFQELLDDPDKELRVSIEQIIPARRKLRLYSAPARDESGTLVGRIDVYTDVTESVRRADEVERLYDEARRTAESYQRSFLPDQIPTLPRLSMVARYIPAAATIVVQSAYMSAGQRCTAARRLIVREGAHAPLIEAITRLADRMIVDHPHANPAPFMGPVIDNAAADHLQDAFLSLLGKGARIIRRLDRPDDSRPFLTPALIDVTEVSERSDAELFGPILQMIRVPDFDAAIAEANATRFGLAASLIGGGPELYDRFWANVRAGVINWNKPTNGAPSNAPFGGIGISGNHRPSAYYAADYCAYPVTSSEAESPRASIGVGLKDPAAAANELEG